MKRSISFAVAVFALSSAPLLAVAQPATAPAGKATTGTTGTGTTGTGTMGAGTAGAGTAGAPGSGAHGSGHGAVPSGTGAHGATGTADADSGPAPAEILSKLHHSNQMEVEAGKLAQEKGHSKEVKNFGKLLVKDHTAADKKVLSLAKQLKVELAAAAPMKHEKLEQARALSGPEFDRAFAASMVDDHRKDVQDATDARDRTTNPKLKKLLTQLVPKLEKHRATAEKLAAAEPTPAK